MVLSFYAREVLIYFGKSLDYLIRIWGFLHSIPEERPVFGAFWTFTALLDGHDDLGNLN